VDSVKVAAFAAYFKNLFIIRSIELASVAYKFGLLNSYIPPRKGGRSVLVDSILWATKSNGCAVTEHEIEEMKGILLKK
jgi:hypothetical protein